jgi:hypothetical protein
MKPKDTSIPDVIDRFEIPIYCHWLPKLREFFYRFQWVLSKYSRSPILMAQKHSKLAVLRISPKIRLCFRTQVHTCCFIFDLLTCCLIGISVKILALAEPNNGEIIFENDPYILETKMELKCLYKLFANYPLLVVSTVISLLFSLHYVCWLETPQRKLLLFTFINISKIHTFICNWICSNGIDIQWKPYILISWAF